MNWNKYPFLRLVFAFALGIVIRNATVSPCVGIPFLFCVLLALLGIVILLSRLVKSYRYRWVFGAVTLFVFAFLGYFRAGVQEPFSDIHYNKVPVGEGWYLARVLEPPTEKEKTLKVELELEGFKSDTLMMPVAGRVMAYFQKSEETASLDYGDVLLFSSSIREVSPPMNPEEFDYKRYLERRGVSGTVFLRQGEWFHTGMRNVHPIRAFAYRFRESLLSALQRCGVTEDEFGVGAAILLGYDESLPAQVRQNYVAAGAMHILCVSGMHVGIIYLLASFILGFMGKGKKAAFVRRIVLLVLIWFYALLTGLSPSIMRSALMISFLIFGELIRRKGYALNSIAASAFFILLVNPNNLYAIGFQLSYVAVVGIVLLQRPIYNLLYIKNKLLDKMWEITAVSIAAQIATMPFTVYYFNQFTPYFWLSNLFMTPLSFVVILSGMLLLMVSWVPVLGIYMGKVVWTSLHLMNGLVAGIERLPLSLVKGLYMTDFQFVLTLMMLLLLWLFVNLKKKRMMMELLALSVVFAVTMAWRVEGLARQSQLVFYSVRNHTAISIVDGFRDVFVCDEGLLAEPSSIDYSLRGHWSALQLSMNPTCFTLDEDFSNDLVVKKNRFVSVQGRLLVLWNPVASKNKKECRIPVDYLLVREKQKLDFQNIVNNYEVGVLLIDGSVPDYLASEWERQAEIMQIPCQNLKKGAFVVNL